jgi:hypothetical protein
MNALQRGRDFQRAGAFVVQFRTATDFEVGRVEGRLEHVVSGATAHFESAAELLELFARLWKDVQADSPFEIQEGV